MLRTQADSLNYISCFNLNFTMKSKSITLGGKGAGPSGNVALKVKMKHIHHLLITVLTSIHSLK